MKSVKPFFTVGMSLFFLAVAVVQGQPGGGTPNGSITGTVYNSADTSALSNATVILSQGLIQGQNLDTAQTDVNGMYHFDTLATGGRNVYTLNVSLTDYDDASQSSIRLDPGETDTIDFYLVKTDTTKPPDTTIPGTGGFVGTVTDSASGSALLGAKVILSMGTGPLGTAVDSTFTDAGGKYKFTGVQIGTRNLYALNVSLANFQPQSATRLILDSTGQVDTEDFKLVSMDTAGAWVVMGKVTGDSANGTPLESVFVELVREFGTEVRYSGYTDAEGGYAILVAGTGTRYTINASLGGYLTTDTIFLVNTDSATVNFVLLPDITPILYAFNGDTVTIPRPLFKWHPVNDATSYRVEISVDAGFSSPTFTQVADTTYTPLVDLIPDTYYWRISSDLDPKLYSEIDSFVVKNSLGVSRSDALLGGSHFLIHPNPNNGRFALIFSMENKSYREITFRMFDVTGRKIRTEKVVNWRKTNRTGNLQISSRGLPAGTYLWLFDGNRVTLKSGKILIIK